MKKNILAVTLAVILTVSLLCIPASAANPPTTPGLYFENAGFSTSPSMSNYSPSNFYQTGFTINPYSATVDVPSDATYICFMWWNHYEEAAGRGYMITGTTSYSVNDYYAAFPVPNSEGRGNYTTDSYGGVRAEVRYVTIPASSFPKGSNDSFTVKVNRVNKLGVSKTYSIKYWINWTAPTVPPEKPIPEAPTSATYNLRDQEISGLTTSMQFRYSTGSTPSPWYSFSSGSNNYYNMYPHLSTLRTTSVEVRYKETSTHQASKIKQITIPKLDPAPTGLSFEWYSGSPALFGLDASRYYTISPTANFDMYYSVGPGYNAVLLDGMGLTAGSSIYVRSSANTSTASASSAYAVVSVPSQVAAPTALYDKPSATLYGLYNTMDFRIGYPEGWTGWAQVTANNAYFGAYSYLRTDCDTTLQVRYRNTPTAIQTIVVPRLEAAPAGLEFEWVDGIGLILWGFEPGNYYGMWTDPYFDNWYDYDGEYPGLNVSVLNLQPGDTFYVRVAPNDSTYPSDFAAVTVPAMPVAAASAFSIGDTEASEQESVSSEIMDSIAEIQLNSIVIPDGQEVVLENDEISDAETDGNSQMTPARNRAAVESEGEMVFGSLEEIKTESDNEPTISPENTDEVYLQY